MFRSSSIEAGHPLQQARRACLLRRSPDPIRGETNMIAPTKSRLTLPRFAAAACLLGLAGPASAGPPVEVRHRTVKVGDLDIFYREAGPGGAPTVLLLHGFPTSSQMFRKLIPALGDEYHVVAP